MFLVGGASSKQNIFLEDILGKFETEFFLELRLNDRSCLNEKSVWRIGCLSIKIFDLRGVYNLNDRKYHLIINRLFL